MIPCQACQHENPISARYCHSCGVKLERNEKVIYKAVAADQSDDRSWRWLGRGNSTMLLGMFLLIAALVFRYILVPTMPLVEVPQVDVGQVLPTPPATPPPVK